MDLGDLKGVVVLLALVSLFAAATAIALNAFSTSSAVTTGSAAYNITRNGLLGITNSTSYLDVTGTIAGVAVLIGIVVVSFGFMNRQ